MQDFIQPLFFYLKRILAGPIERPLELRISWYSYFQVQSYHHLALTQEKIEEELKKVPPEQTEKLRLKLEHILKRATHFAQTMRVAKFELYGAPKDATHPGFSANYTDKGGQIFFNYEKLLQMSEDEIDFRLAHEMAHLKYRDPIRKVACNAMVTISSIACFIFMSAYMSFVAGLCTYLFVDRIGEVGVDWVERRTERQADLEALKTLQTGQGALEIFASRLKQLLKLKAEHDPAFEHLISPWGDLRIDWTHPSYTERLFLALPFQKC